MSLTQTMKSLKSLGTAQNRKVYARHGVRGACFGVSYANQGKLAKKIGVDQELAVKLWASGNHDARVLATKIADAGRCTASLLDGWVKEVDCYVLGDALAGLAASAPSARKRMEKWIRSGDEWIGSTGWMLLAVLAMKDEALEDSELAARLEEIESRIVDSPNRVRHAMNMALIAIGIRNSRLEKLAMRAARRIGKVEVDHGQTGCQTPDAADYIRRTLARRKGRAMSAR